MTLRYPDELGLTWSERRIYDVLAAAEAPLPPAEVARRTFAAPGLVAADEQLVRQHVSNMRKKLGFDAIENYRGIGYCLPRHRGEVAS